MTITRKISTDVLKKRMIPTLKAISSIKKAPIPEKSATRLSEIVFPTTPERKTPNMAMEMSNIPTVTCGLIILSFLELKKCVEMRSTNVGSRIDNTPNQYTNVSLMSVRTVPVFIYET